jgi:hypothetical protein
MEEKCIYGFGGETDQIEKTEMGGICSTYGGEVYGGFWQGNRSSREERDGREM